MDATNWAGNYTYRASRLERPRTLDEVRELVASAERVRIVGSRHSFTGIGDSALLISLAGLAPDVAVDHTAGTATFSAGMTYAELARALEREGVALQNLASLPHISVGGSIATATHGSGDGNGNLATQVAGLELVTSSGDVIHAARGDADFGGLVVGLGALGAVTRVTLDVEPEYEVRQHVFEGLSWDALLEHFGAVTASAYSVSVFSRWGDAPEMVWLKSRDGDEPRSELLGARPATVERHPIIGLDAVRATPQLGVPGPWYDRLPHFRIEFTPSNGEEIQSEYFVAREHAAPAIRAMLEIGDAIRPALQVCEIRTMAADELWLSPQYRQDTIGLHFTWIRDQAAVERALARVEAALAPFAARPHWGKVFLAQPGPHYERLGGFAALAERLDPRGAFRNDWLERVLG
jgi:xylitol oxidase